jgi:Peptidase family M28/PDZ domain/PA domain
MGTPTPRRSGASTCRGRVGARLLLALAVAATAAAPGPVRAAESVPEAARLLGWVRDLTDPAMEGRAAGTPGADRAAAYLAAEFQRLGLRPAGDAGGFLQRFEVLTGVRLAPGAAIEVTAAGAAPHTFAGGTAFLPFTFSMDGDVTSDVAFAGYGITAPPLGYDDYAGLDVRGKVVLVMTGEPRETDPQGPFRPAEHFHYTELRHKVLNAREHGAGAVIVVENPGRGDRLAALRGATPSWGIVAVSARREVAHALLIPGGLDLAGLRARIERASTPASRVVPGVRARIRATLLRDRGTTANVVGILPGADPALAAEAVVIGAHYDHLGRGSPFSLAPERGDAIHPGADDNASGTAALLGLAETLTRGGAGRRSVVVIAFSAEELGLLGSTHYVGQPVIPLDRTVAMVNLDSVGRLRDGRLHVMGVDTGQGLRALVEQAGHGLPAQLALRGDGVGPSDHTPFLNRERPIVFFFTGPHADYHRPSDTWDKIDADGLRTVTTVAYRVVRALADREDRPAFVRVPGGPPRAGTGATGYGPYFGAVPDFGESPHPGVRLGGVRPGSPADRAGLRAGDVIVRFAGVTVRTLDDLVFALRGRRPGEAIEVTYVRDGAERAAQATLEERR